VVQVAGSRRTVIYERMMCAAARINGCDNDRMFDYAVIEREFLSVFTVIVAKFIQSATPSADRLRPIRERQSSVRLNWPS
jgi:hypothetical protein